MVQAVELIPQSMMSSIFYLNENMKSLVPVFCLFSTLVLVQVSATEVYSFEAFLEREYEVTNKPLEVFQYQIVAAKKTTVDEAIKLIQATELGTENRAEAFAAACAILSAFPNSEQTRSLIQVVEEIESVSLDDRSYWNLQNAYVGLARIGTDETLEFLKTRASYEFWENRDLPEKTMVMVGAGTEVRKTNAIFSAIYALGLHEYPDAGNFLNQILSDERYIIDPLSYDGLEIKSSLNAHELDIEHRKRQIDEAIALRESIFGTSVEAVLLPHAIEPDMVKDAEAIEEYTVSEPAIEEDIEQPSSLWLWVIGILAVVGCTIMLRRKS